MEVKHILIIDDNADFRNLLKNFLSKMISSVEVDEYDPPLQGRPAADFDWSGFDIVFLDYDLGGGENGLDWLRAYKINENFPPTVILTAHGDEELAARAIKFGAQDYINKSKISKNRLVGVIDNAIKVHAEQSRVVSTQSLRTTIFNKAYFYRKLGELLDRGQADIRSFLLQIRIDDFSELNKKLGILRADHLVSEVAETISRLLHSDRVRLNVTRTGDAVIGCLVSGQLGNNDGDRIAEILCNKLAVKEFFHNDQKISFNVSIGLKQIVSSDTDLETLLQLLDQACEAAGKEQGNSFINCGNDRPAAKSKSTDKPERSDNTWFDLKGAIDNDRVQVYFQPLIAMSASAGMLDSELSRLQVQILDQEGNTYNPDNMKNPGLKSADRGLLDRWMIRYGLAKLLAVYQENTAQKYGLLIPLSRDSLLTDSFSGWMSKLILKSKILNIASTIVFEINPIDFLSNKDNTLAIMRMLKEKWGVSFALTDVLNKSVLKTCLHRGGFEFVKLDIDNSRIEEMQEIAVGCKEYGSLTILGNIQDGEGLAYAAHANFDYALGDFIQPPQDELVYIEEAIEETTL
jgi:diguanylate cyclase (GGDEF)-like protein